MTSFWTLFFLSKFYENYFILCTENCNKICVHVRIEVDEF
jgi:hypothetical protein